MEGILTQRVTPLLKCMVLFLFIFTAKVLTSRPQESQEIKNGIHQLKPAHYVRTFTKYHHRRTIQWNNLPEVNYWPNDQPKYVGKRSIYNINNAQNEPDIQRKKRSLIKKYWPVKKRSVEFSKEVGSGDGIVWNQYASDTVKENIVGSMEKKSSSKENNKIGYKNEIREYKVKAAKVYIEPSTTMGPSITCLYKMYTITISVTPSYKDDKNAQSMIENDTFDTGPITDMVMPDGAMVQVQQCTNPRASCYTLWHQQNEGNITVLGQGCWWSSQSRNACDKCVPAAPLPGSKFCCCTKSYCNADFMSIRDETVTMRVELPMEASRGRWGSWGTLGLMGGIVAMLILAAAVVHIRCGTRDSEESDKDSEDVEKGEVMGCGPDALATGLLCVDNLTLIEHIGQGKFGSVWRGTLGSTDVAVKLYCNSNAWQKEAAMYALPHLAHSNILLYYGSDTRPSLTEGGIREYLIVVELCPSTLRAHLERNSLKWIEFATLARGLSSALAHLHTPNGNKPCVVHRDVNSNNVLISANGEARLGDLGLAQALHPRREHTAPSRITEAGTLRYLAPEALEGALDLSGARAALCAVDVFALGLVLWEMVWRTEGAHVGRTPPYAQPYSHHGLPQKPTLAQMQSLVSRNKARPPLPTGPVPEPKILKIATDTCDECWDHDAEARLTAVCVEERMMELKHMLENHAPLIHDNNLHPSAHCTADTSTSSTSESDKNSNCTTTQNCDVTTPLLYPHPHIGRNACIERNTHNTQVHTVQLIHKSLKDISIPPEVRPEITVEEKCLSVARVPHHRSVLQENASLNEIRPYQRPLEYVQNDVSSMDFSRGPKDTNLHQEVKVEKSKWGIKKFFEKLNKNKLETEVKLVPQNDQRTKTSVVTEKPSNINFDKPSNLVINDAYNFEGPCTLSPPNKTLSPTMMGERLGFKELSSQNEPNQIFAVIVPKVKPDDTRQKSKGSTESINKSVRTSMSSQSMFKSNSESEDSAIKKRLSDQKINSGNSSRASIIELQYIGPENYNGAISPFDVNSDCSSSEDEHLMLLSENGGSKITMQSVPKEKYNEVLKETTQAKTFNFQNKYANFENEYSDPNDKENLVNGYSGDNPVYLAALNGEINTEDLRYENEKPKSPKPNLKSLAIRRQHSLEQVSEIFTSAGDINLLNPAGRVKTPGDLPVAIRRARRDRALQKGRASESNRLSLYDDRMMFGNTL
ncbi:hypothetical protein K1T71_014233 [Dendrolimus kikuchii]|uniref:Uncharacterized protein n=1 Tax=Dendrolimus kikuchii TaxID=765133 RepID=A0ACC1CFM8_9NEOP|nr:hypothetical protein K1T71_014233 [Dendrolimus kikuchii]